MHTASLGDAEQWPSLPLYRTYRTHAGPQARTVRSPVWFRVVGLAHYRGQVDTSAYRLAQHVSQWAHKSGRIPDMGDVMEAYQTFYGLSRRTAWADVKRLGIHGAGYIRQTAAPAPGRNASYALCLPQTLPQGLPGDLEAELLRVLARPTRYTVTAPNRTDADPAKAVSEPETVTRVSTTRVQTHETLSDLTMYSRGSVLTPESQREEEEFPTWLHTSPLSRGTSTPTQKPARKQRGQRPTMGNTTTSLNDITAEVLRRCAGRWQAQRPAAGGLDEDSTQRLRPLIRGALMYQASADVISTITEAVASARNLGAVVAHRLREMILRGRKIAQLDTVKADDQGEYAAQVQAERARAASAYRSEAAEEARASIREILAGARPTPVGLADRRRPEPLAPSTFAEPAAEFADELSAAGIPATTAQWEQAAAEIERERSRQAAVARSRTGQAPWDPQGPSLDEAAASEDGDPPF